MAPGPLALLRTAFAGTSAVAVTGVMAPVIAGVALARATAADPLMHAWATALLASAGVRSAAEGLEHVPAGHCVFVCNHQSHYDAPVILKHVRKHVRYVAKAELGRIPVFGQALRATGNVMVSRQGGSSDREKLGDAVQAVRERVSVLFFAEGTRSFDGVLRPFKRGAAMLALQAGVPVVPMAVSGTRLILPKGGRAVRWGQRVSLVVGPPEPTEGLSVNDREALTLRLQERVAQLYARARELSGDAAGTP